MDQSENPFSNLDLWCDWTGEPTDPVEVVVSVEVWCTPDIYLPVLNTRSSHNLHIVEYGISLKTPNFEKAESVRGGLRIRDSPIKIREVREPSIPADQSDTENDDESPDEDAPSIYSDQDSTIVQPGQDGVSVQSDPFYISVTSLLPADDETPMPSPNPRKRNAKAASLPDSVTDSERSYGGCGSKYKTLAAKQPDSSTSKHSRRQSLIPRPVTSPDQSVWESNLNARVPPLDYKTILAEGYRQLEASFPSPVSKENDPIPERTLLGMDRSNAPSPDMLVSTAKMKGMDDFESKRVREYRNLSTDAMQGSPCNMSMLSSSPGSVPSLEAGSSRMDTPSGRTDSHGESHSLHISDSPRDLLPLHTTQSSGDLSPQINTDCPEEENLQFDVPAQLDFSASSYSPITGPELVLTNGIFHIRSMHDLYPAAYEVSITFLLPLQSGRPRGWWEFIVPGLPRLARNEHGYVYFRTPPGQGMEFRTTHFKRYNLVESCLMAQFLIPSKLVITLRPCESRFYGFLKDFKITQAIRAEVVVCEDNDSIFHIVKYRAICSIDLLQRDFWAKKCGFYIWIHGGPEGEWVTILPDVRRRFETIKLSSKTTDTIGVSELQVICNPSHLGMFVLAWTVKVPRGRTTLWMPRIRASLDKADIEEGLQAEFEEAESPKTPDMVRANPIDNEIRDTRRKGTFWKSFRSTCYALVVLFLLIRLAAHFYEINFVYRATQKIAIAEPEPEHLDGTPEQEPVPGPVPGPESATLLGAIVPTSMPLRDRIDYLLGWKGPISSTQD
ncbi:uncharacterized protein N7443_007046 [Penicillium atrosanguineum]|uniref:uncharacterized protein n=1 Tax=Penicillium atrosanguineum TaxID=1132637 RepID=UPI00239AB845|nr:uncharacterized protein N7443_007046 [Penicillium atrosanguineum]KAJ5298926.1 hypothetical protein N7443_007046 [Penicillium atrosanguineum]